MDRLGNVELVGCDEPAMRDTLQELQSQSNRIRAHITAIAAQLTDRQARRISPDDPDDRRARQQAEQDTQRELADTLHITHSEAKDAVQAGASLNGLSAETRDAFEAGEITPRHARKLRETLDSLLGLADRDTMEAQLLEAARDQSTTEFGPTCRDLVARTDTEQAQRDIDQLRRRRFCNVTQDHDGMVRGSFAYAGIDAELVLQALETFRTKDRPGDFRSTGQRTADALLDAVRVGLEHCESTEHGNRPHILVHVDHQELISGDGVVETTFTGTLPLSEARPVIEDSTITRIIHDPDGQVIDVGRATRVIPGPAWRGIVARDRGCTLDGCGAPPARCQAAHLNRRWATGAGTSVHEQAMAC